MIKNRTYPQFWKAIAVAAVALMVCFPVLQSFLHNHAPGSAHHPDCAACGATGAALALPANPPPDAMALGTPSFVCLCTAQIPLSSAPYSQPHLRAPPTR